MKFEKEFDNSIVGKIKSDFEQKCLLLLVEAYNTLLTTKEFQSDWIENDFSRILCEYIEDNPLSAKENIFCKTEGTIFPINTNLERGYADKLPRVDFVYSKSWKLQKFKYVIEAKRLKQKDSNLKREYIKEGMERFISKKYPHGGMIGYLLEGDVLETIKGINSLLKKDKRNTEFLVFKKYDLHDFYYESEHIEIGILKHFIFDFTEE